MTHKCNSGMFLGHDLVIFIIFVTLWFIRFEMTLWFFENDSKGMKKGPLTALLYINRGGDSKMYHSVASKQGPTK